METIQILKEYPLLIPSHNFKTWIGFVHIEDEEIQICFHTPYFPTLKDFTVMCSPNKEIKVQSKLKCYEKMVDFKNSGFLQLLDYLRKNQDKQMKNIKDELEDGLSLKLDYYLYTKILNELKQLGNANIKECNSDMSRLTLRSVDEKGVEHPLVINIPSDYPVSRPTVVDVELPQVGVTEISQASTILEMYNSFKNLIDSFQEFWDAYESLWRNAWVIDPEHPSRKDIHCRIIIGENISMLLTLNPLEVNTCPDIKFLGPENAVTPFINSLENKLKSVGWQEDISMVDNLLSLLSLAQFPRQDNQNDVVVQQNECCICFMMRLPDQSLPIKVCNNIKCSSYFHISCLAQWFQALPTNESSFNFISGDCPCCGERILCPVKDSG